MKQLKKNLYVVVLCIFASLPISVVNVWAQNGSPDATTELTTANGLKIIHRRITGNEVVSAQLFFLGGTTNYTEKNAGIENLLFDVAQQGTKNYSKSQINRELSGMGTEINSGAGYDFSVVEMKCVKQNFEKSWSILTDVILNPLFDEKEVALEKDKLLSALKQQNDYPELQVDLLSRKLLFAGHPYLNSPTGTVSSISMLTGADLKAHHKILLESSRMLLVVVGNVPAEELKAKAEAAYGKLKKGEYTDGVSKTFPNAAKPEFQAVNKTVATNYIRGAFAAPSLDSPDYPAFFVAVNILSQLMFQEVRVKRNLTYNVDAELLTNRAGFGYITVTTAKPDETLKVIFDQVDFLRLNTLREEALKTLVGGILTKYYSDLETNSAQGAKLAEYEMIGGGWKNLSDWLFKVSKVSAADVKRVSETYLKDFHFAAVGNPTLFDKSLFSSR